jgi:hypothetical protein
MIRTFLSVACVAAALATPNAASAFWPYGGYGGGYGWGWGYIQPTNKVPAPPYYAVHPPVYYSPHITARHYGASPFAWLPGMQPITYVPEPVMTIRQNTAVKAEDLMAGTGDKTAALVIENPYVTKKVAANEEESTPAPVKIENPFFASR